MSLSPDALKESKIKAINNFKSNGKPPSIKASHLQQKLIPDVYGKKIQQEKYVSTGSYLMFQRWAVQT